MRLLTTCCLVLLTGASLTLNAQPSNADFNCDQTCNTADLLFMIAEYGVCTGYCRTDMNCDGVVNTADKVLFLANWGTSGCIGDYNDDGVVNTSDWLTFIGLWSAGCPTADIDCSGSVNSMDYVLMSQLFGTTCRMAQPDPVPPAELVARWFEATDEAILIQPNPVRDRVVIASVLGLDPSATLEVYGTDGRLVAAGQAMRLELDLSGQPSGLYIVRATLGDAVQTAKLIKVD